MRGPAARVVLGTECSQVRWQEPPITIRSPCPSGRRTVSPPPRRAQQQVPRRAHGEDRDHRVLARAPPDPVPVPGDTVPAVAVVAQPGRGERLAQLLGVVRARARRAPRPAPGAAARRPRRRTRAAGVRRRRGRTSCGAPRAREPRRPAVRTGRRLRSSQPGSTSIQAPRPSSVRRIPSREPSRSSSVWSKREAWRCVGMDPAYSDIRKCVPSDVLAKSRPSRSLSIHRCIGYIPVSNGGRAMHGGGGVRPGA